MRLSEFIKSPMVPSAATGAVTGAAALGYSIVDMGSKVYWTAASVNAGGLLTYFSGVDLSNAADILSRVPAKVFVGGAVIGGALGLSVAIGHEISKKILTEKEDSSKDGKKNSIVSSAMVPACLTGAIGGSAVALQGTAVTQGLNVLFQRPVFGFLSVAGPKIVRKAAYFASWTPQCVQNLAQSMIEPLGFVSAQNILIGAAAGMALGVTLTVAYEVAKRALENSSTNEKKEGEGVMGPNLSPKRVTSYSPSKSLAFQLD